MTEAREWYTNKELYEMMVDLSKGLEQTNLELTKTNAELANTQSMIREYNGLRARLDECDRKFAEIIGQKTGGKDMWGYLVGGIGVLFALISYVAR